MAHLREWSDGFYFENEQLQILPSNGTHSIHL